ncbi:hypothetical protein GCM10023322_56020 [Rugosimonospora acidiphila]|uniref:Uncharacterized protein n=1 Tax=Rugosimonospora acidiphila TaxID=556531 RepID=A0ABP9SB07_9ACTN
MAAGWGTRPLDTIAASDIEALQRDMAANALPRRDNRGGVLTGDAEAEHGIGQAPGLPYF